MNIKEETIESLTERLTDESLTPFEVEQIKDKIRFLEQLNQ